MCFAKQLGSAGVKVLFPKRLCDRGRWNSNAIVLPFIRIKRPGFTFWKIVHREKGLFHQATALRQRRCRCSDAGHVMIDSDLEQTHQCLIM